MREIMTLQIGGFANFVDSHFWNFQNQHIYIDVLYCLGETQHGRVSYTPHLGSPLIYDAFEISRSLGPMSSRGTLYNESTSATLEVKAGNVSTHASGPHKKNLFLQHTYEEEQENATLMEVGILILMERFIITILFLESPLLCELSGLWMDVLYFDNYGVGSDAFSRVLEENKSVKGLFYFILFVFFIVDDSGGFSVIVADFLENMADEHPNTPVLLFSVYTLQTVLKDLHDVVSFSKLSSFSKLIIPFGLPSLSTSNVASYLCIEDKKPYHCSIVYASTLHTICLPFWMDYGLIDMLAAGQGRQNMVSILDQILLNNLQGLTLVITENEENSQVVESITVQGTFSSATSRPMFCHL
ncbi:hypothetical protein UlMin_043779 [Ulmus minor]